MLDLSWTKLLVILIVVCILVGPQRIPQVARGLARGWLRIRALQAEIDQELQRSLPGLPRSQDLAGIVRSPAKVLDHLAGLNALDDTHVNLDQPTQADHLSVESAPSQAPAQDRRPLDPGTLVDHPMWN